MALLQACAGDTHELAVGTQLLDIVGAAVAHTGAQAAHHLVYSLGHGSPVRHTAFYAFGYQLLVVGLEVTILGALLHGAQTAHAPVYLELTSLIYLHFAGGLLAAGKHGAHHDNLCAGGNCLDDVAGVLYAAVGNDGDAVLVTHLSALKYRADLGHTYACHNTCGADGTGANANLDAVRARLYQGLGGLSSGHIACHQLDIGEFLLDQAHTAHDICGVTMGAVQYQNIHAGVNEGGGAIQHIGSDAYGGGTEQAAGSILGGVRIFQYLFNILDSDKALELIILVHNGQLLYAVLLKNGLGLVQSGALVAGDKVFVGHNLIYTTAHIGLELHVSVGDDAYEVSLIVHDGNA